VVRWVGKRQFTDQLIRKHIFRGGYILPLLERDKLLLKYDFLVIHKEALRFSVPDIFPKQKIS
jgi:hypothetical protein